MSQPPRIRILPTLLVNKIAAGEVIERPASVVKELLDNAVDALRTDGAGSPPDITVATEQGGTELIRVTDNAGGMTPEELELAVQPHATSKLTDEEDLYRIATLGFRGEALASIGAVSRLRIVSRTPDQPFGHEVRVAGRSFEASQAAGCPIGTTVEVRDLFFNVPARRRFLKKASTEAGHITEMFTRAALAFPEIGFRLMTGGRTVHQLAPVRSRAERIARLFGDELGEVLLPVERSGPGVILDGFAAPPAHARVTGTWQYMFVNGRFIRDRHLQHAVKEAFRGLIEPSRFPTVFLFLTIDPDKVDVNVHPTKIEVRWAEPGLMHSLVFSALRDTLRAADLTPALSLGRAVPDSESLPMQPSDPVEQERRRREFVNLLLRTPPTTGMMTPGTGPFTPSADEAPRGLPSAGTAERIAEDDFAIRGSSGGSSGASQLWRSFYQSAPLTSPPPQGRETSASSGDDNPLAEPAVMRSTPSFTDEAAAPLAALGRTAGPRRAIQLHNTYIVTETDDGLLIIDQHALHERIMFEQILARVTAGVLESQRLLLPESIPATPSEIAAVQAYRNLLERLGMDVDAFGADHVAVHAFPSLLRNVDIPSFLRDLLDKLSRFSGDEGVETIIHAVIDMMACKAAVKAGDTLTQEEIDALVAQKALVERSSNCPHGRPTTLRLTKSDLERQFRRT